MIRIKAFREKKGLTQAGLAEMLDLTQSAVAMWENGTNLPRTDLLPRISQIFGCQIDDLFGLDSDDTQSAS